MNRSKRFTPEQALEKIKHYCAYQERSHYEVRERLFGFGLNAREVDSLMADLISQNYVNEERFAILFAGGKFRQKKWGRKRIVYELKTRKVSDFNIKVAIAAIDPEDYRETIRELIRKKKDLLVREAYGVYELRAKILTFLTQKGFEAELAQDVYKQVSESDGWDLNI